MPITLDFNIQKGKDEGGFVLQVLERGKKLLLGSLDAVHDAAKSLLTGLEVITGIYLGILGFAKYIPNSMNLPAKSLFLLPLLFWLVAIYSALQALMTKKLRLNLHAPDDIREKSQQLLLEKQKSLRWSFSALTLGLLSAFLLLILRSYL